MKEAIEILKRAYYDISYVKRTSDLTNMAQAKLEEVLQKLANVIDKEIKDEM